MVSPFQSILTQRKPKGGVPATPLLYHGGGMSLLVRPRVNLSFEKKQLIHKMSKNNPKIYTKPQNILECSKWRDLALLETRTRYWHKGHVERRENILQVKSRLKPLLARIRLNCLELRFWSCISRRHKIISFCSYRTEINVK